MVRSSTLLLGALALWIYDLSPCSSIGVVGLLNLGARKSGSLEERLRGGKPSSRSGRSRTPGCSPQACEDTILKIQNSLREGIILG